MIPALVEIIPPTSPIRAQITVPGSKSITNRALILAALSDGEVVLDGALWSEDTQVMVACLQELGFMVRVDKDPHESSNRQITIYGKGGEVPRGGTREQPLDLFVGNAGTAARFLSALVCLGSGYYRLSGVPRMHQRPQADLFKALRGLGYEVLSENDKLPALIRGEGPKPQSCVVSIEESSQFASALLLSGRTGRWEVKIVGENADESPYVAMTAQLIESFPWTGGTFEIEPDASGGSYFWAARFLQLMDQGDLSDISVCHWPTSGWQVDAEFPRFWPLPRQVSRREHLGDSIMTAIVLAPFAAQETHFEDLGRLRVQECERVKALAAELERCGGKVREVGDSLVVSPGQLHGAEIETYEDHRMAMCFAILGLKIPGIKIKNPACVKKTFPNFFQKMAETSPEGLGVAIHNPLTGKRLELDELFAD